MTHKIVSAVVALVLVLFVGAACAFAWSVSARAPQTKQTSSAPAVPHGTSGGRADCTSCHAAKELPASHREYSSDGCLSCHQEAGVAGIPHDVTGENADCARCHRTANGTQPLTHREFPASSCRRCHSVRPAATVPHTVAMGDDRCVLCHGETAAPLGMPSSHPTIAGTPCAFCHHPDTRKASVQPPPAGTSAEKAPAIAHAVTGIFKDCLSCHQIGGRPPLPAGHRGFGEDTCRFVCHLRGS